LRREVNRAFLASAPAVSTGIQVTKTLNSATVICGHRRPVDGLPEKPSRISARNCLPKVAAWDSRERSLRYKVRLQSPESDGRAPDLPGCRNRFSQKSRAFFLPYAGHGHAPAAGIYLATGRVSNASAEMTSRSIGLCRGAGQARTDVCDQASGNRWGKVVPRAQQREAVIPGIGSGKDYSASPFPGQTRSKSSERRHRPDKAHGTNAEDKKPGLSSLNPTPFIKDSGRRLPQFFSRSQGHETLINQAVNGPV